jgi:hypothetical protein
MNSVFYVVCAKMLQGGQLEQEFQQSCKEVCEEKT